MMSAPSTGHTGLVPRPRRGGVPGLLRPAWAAPAGREPASAWLPSAPCTPGACVESARAVTAVPRAVLRLVSLLVVVAAGVVLIPVVARVPAARRDRLVRVWCRTIVRTAGVRVRTTGAAPPTGGLLLVANHISWLDIPLLAAVRPGRMLAKAEIRRWPVAGALTASSGALFIERDRLRALPATVARIADTLRGGAAVVVFPEGSTWCGRARGRFRRAVFQAALDADVAVQPVRLRYRRRDGGAVTTAPAFVGSDSLLTSVWRVVSARGLVAEVHVPPVLPPGGAPDRRTLALAAETATDHRATADHRAATDHWVTVHHRPAGARRLCARDTVKSRCP
ncbi:1-acyl-sn-glycerol-3-phosphate acyltransferase [Streptomyces aurantiacus]|uniref:lysophospholipid acyltransferase family protein n=1 Tax=Streptomyces aurantiacus TaxID=47760 RepID=UPI0027910D27|nr:lysophospholipid acyltransferase family protein [Streptomyces aurantiacus]MDQ0772633.1 1-acyl-sn-glycerol-3-phosphate acyltransferase [Streptomyces aurantiacus]